MGVEQIGQRARTEFDEDDSAPSTSGKGNGASSSENTRLFGEGLLLSYAFKLAQLNKKAAVVVCSILSS